MSNNAHVDRILWGGLAGGAAELVVVGLYAGLAGVGGWAVAEGVSRATFGATFSGTEAVLVGLAVHFALSLLIAAVFMQLVPRLMHSFGRQGVVLAATAALGCVWMLNFRVLLPIITPEFVTIVPLPVSLASKLAFGFAMGVVLVGHPRLSGWPRRTPA